LLRRVGASTSFTRHAWLALKKPEKTRGMGTVMQSGVSCIGKKVRDNGTAPSAMRLKLTSPSAFWMKAWQQ